MGMLLQALGATEEPIAVISRRNVPKFSPTTLLLIREFHQKENQHFQLKLTRFLKLGTKITKLSRR